ncbi:DMT family transporter [Slackia heliotrinireducens]|uniref:DMT family transporter n=1 Tax=Slackia heliotrinireducens TaxID=84110 RepID=UPI003315C0CA
MNANKERHLHLPVWVYKGMLLLAAAVWGLGTVVLKDTVDALPPLWLIAVRFVLAGIILGAVCYPRMRDHLDRDTLLAGAFLGVFVGVSYGLNTIGLLYTTAAKSTVLTSAYCVMVPFVAWAASKIKPSLFNLVAAALCLTGVGFVSLQGSTEGLFTIGLGESITLLAAVFFALQIAYMAKLGDGRDAMVLTVVQFLVGGGLCAVGGLLFEGPLPLDAFSDPAVVRNLAYLIVVASCLALSLQNVGLAHVSPAPAALFLASESLFGVIFSILFLGEAVSANVVVGFVLITSSIVISETFPHLRSRSADNR